MKHDLKKWCFMIPPSPPPERSRHLPPPFDLCFMTLSHPTTRTTTPPPTTLRCERAKQLLKSRGAGELYENGISSQVGEIYIMLTWDCNLRCRMCPMWGKKGFCKIGKFPKKTITLDLLLRFLNEALKFNPRCVTISGGEPLLSPICIPLARSLSEKGVKVMMTTNATLLRKLKPDEIRYFSQINVSLDGPPLVLEKLGRGGSKTFDLVVEGLNYILNLRESERKPLLQLITVITPEGIGKLLDTLKLFEKFDVFFDRILLQHEMFLKSKTAMRHEEELEKIFGRKNRVPIWRALSRGKRQIDIHKLNYEIKKIKSLYSGVVVSPALDNIEDLHRYYYDGSWIPENYNEFCFSPWFDLQITPYGDVWLCPGYSAGNIIESDFETIWNGEKSCKLRKNILFKGIFPGCRACFYLYNY